MGPKSPTPQTQQLFGYPLDQHLNLKHPLIQLAALIDWSEIDKTFSGHFVSDRGRPALPPRLVAGLLYLQHTFDCSDELVVNSLTASILNSSVYLARFLVSLISFSLN